MTSLNFQCGWGQSSLELAARYAKQCPNNVPIWGKLKHVTNNQDVTVNLQKPFNKTGNDIHFRREPDRIESWPPDIRGDCVFDYSSTEKYHTTTWWITKSYDELKDLQYFKKENELSCISSIKHPHRARFIKEISSRTNVDLYGAVANQPYITDTDRDNVFYNYNKSICIENCNQTNYFTEKIIDSLLLWCLPMYWGCGNINSFLPEGSYREINIIDTTEAIDTIVSPVTDKEIKAMSEARQLILDRYNIWACINRLLT